MFVSSVLFAMWFTKWLSWFYFVLLKRIIIVFIFSYLICMALWVHHICNKPLFVVAYSLSLMHISFFCYSIKNHKRFTSRYNWRDCYCASTHRATFFLFMSIFTLFSHIFHVPRILFLFCGVFAQLTQTNRQSFNGQKMTKFLFRFVSR